MWSRVDREVTHHQLPVDIAFGDQTFDASSDVDAFFDTWFIGASYRFAIVANPVVEFGPFLGLVAMHLSTGIGVSESDSGTGSDATEIQEASFTAPAPADSRPRWLHLSRFRTHQWRGRSSAGWRRIHVHAIARRRCELFPQQTLAERG